MRPEGPASAAPSEPYAWPFDPPLDPGRLALVIAGAGGPWRRECRGDPRLGKVGSAVARVASATRAVGGTVIALHHGSGGSGGKESPGESSVPQGLGDVIVDAPGIDGFFASDLDLILRVGGRDHVVLCGFGLEGPVHSTLRSANDRGYESFLLVDACASADPALRCAAVSSVVMSGGIFGAVGSSRHLMSLLDGATMEDGAPGELLDEGTGSGNGPAVSE